MRILNRLLDLISFIDPDIVNSSKFSSRPGTAASKLKKVDDDIISARSERLHNLIKAIAKRRNSKWINWEGEILINEIENGRLKGRNDYYKSIILDRDPDESFLKRKTQTNLSVKNIRIKGLSQIYGSIRKKIWLSKLVRIRIAYYILTILS